MTTEQTAVDEQVEPVLKPKRILERSAAYPSLNLEEAIAFTADVAKNFPVSQVINREDIGAVLNKVAATIQRDVASAAQFKLFIKSDQGGYQISQLYKTLANPLNEAERRKFLLEAFKSPKLYSDLIEKFDTHALPAELKTHLIRFHKIAEKAAPFAAEIFIASAKFCGVLNDKNILNYKQELDKLSNTGIQYAEIITEKDEETIDGRSQEEVIRYAPIDEKPKGMIVNSDVTEERLKIPLTGKRFAYLIYPSDIIQKDTEIIKKQIEVLELLVT